MRLRFILFLAILLGWFVPAQATVIGKSGNLFTIDGQVRFLQGVSYYDCGNYHTSDIDLLAAKGFNLIVCHFDDVLRQDANSLYNNDGSLKAGKVADFHAFATYADSKGIVIDFVVIYADTDGANSWTWLTDPTPGTAVSTAITNAITEFKSHANVFFSAVNEHIYSVHSDAHSETDALMATARAAYPAGLQSFSSTDLFGTYPAGGHLFTSQDGAVVNTTNVDEEIAGGIDMILWHTERNWGWDLRDPLRAANLMSYLSLIGASGLPVLAEEPGREGAGGLGSASAYFAWFRALKAAGLAGAVYHNSDTFELVPDSMMTQIGGSGVDYDVINGLSAALADTTTSPISVIATCTGTVDEGLTTTCTLPIAPSAGDTVIATVFHGSYNGNPQSCINSTGLAPGLVDSQNVEFYLAVESPLSDTNRALIWYRDITTAPSGSYSVTATCPTSSWITLGATVVRGLVPGLGVHDLSGFGSAPAGTSASVAAGGIPMQANELAVAVVSMDISGAGFSVTESSGWSLLHEQEVCSVAFSGHQCGSSVYKMIPAPQAIAHDWTFGGSFNRIATALATFRGVTGNTGTTSRSITWTDNASNETSYTVQKRTDQTTPNWVDVATGLQPNTQSYVATLLDTETGDCWRVAAVNPYGTVYSVSPSEFCVATAPPPPPPPPPPPALQIGGLQTLMDDELL